MAMVPVSATDILDRDGSVMRSLHFMDNSSGMTMTLHFPKDSTVIIRGPREIYDWYGRQIELDEEIEKVIKKFGSRVDGKSIESTHEILLAVKKNGKFTLAELHYKNKGRVEPVFPYFKDVRTGRMVGRTPFLKCGKYEFDKINY